MLSNILLVNHVTNIVTVALRTWRAILHLARGVTGNSAGVTAVRLVLFGAARIWHIFLVIFQTVGNFLEGRVYFEDSGAIVGIIKNNFLIGELNMFSNKHSRVLAIEPPF